MSTEAPAPNRTMSMSAPQETYDFLGEPDPMEDLPSEVGAAPAPQPEVLTMVYMGEISSGQTYRAPGPEWVFLDIREIGRGRRTRHVVVWERAQ